MVILSHFQAKKLLEAHRLALPSALISVDLNLTTTEIQLNEDGIVLPDNYCLPWASVEKISNAETKCFLVEQNSLTEIYTFSEVTLWARSLLPTSAAPSMLVSGIPMHRIQDTDPYHDTLQKIKAIKPLVGLVLDTATGLGYTAIEASKTADAVITVEIDPACLEIARLNPWSASLFDNPKITQIVGDIYDEILEFDDESFSRIIHDPPMFSLAGDLYSTDFYRELYRVLRRRGQLFHYIGNLSSKSGQGVLRGVIRRLGDAGFSRIERKPDAYGVVAFKSN
jgi:hypothetical protein